MKAAMQAAMELEGRLETLENKVEAFQERFEEQFRESQARFAEHQELAASKAEVQALGEREDSARRELLVKVAEKADLEQLGQCLHAVRHELGEVVKRKANSELVESNLQELRKETLELVAEQRTSLAELCGQSEARHTEVMGELHSKAKQEALDQQLATLQVLADEAARRVDLEKLAQYIDTQVPELLEKKADAEAVHQLERAHLSFEEALRGKATTGDVQALQEALTGARKLDGEQLTVGLQDLRTEVLDSLRSKANIDFLEDQIQQTREACLQEARKLSESMAETVQGKADIAYVDYSLQEGLAPIKDLQDRLGTFAVQKADTEKVVEIVEAVREEVMSSLRKRPDFEEEFLKNLNDLGDKLAEKADEALLDQRLRNLRQDFANMMEDKADLGYVKNRIAGLQQTVNEQVSKDILVVREELTLIIGRKVDMDLMDRRMATFEEAVTQAFKVSSAGPSRATSKGRRHWKDEHCHDEDGFSETTAEGWGDRVSESPTMSDMEEWMDQRMKLVKIELTKLVQYKADVDQVNEVRKEVTEHCDSKVQAAEHNLSVHIQQQTQHIRKELKADMNLLTDCLNQVEQTFESMQGIEDMPASVKAFHEILHGKILPSKAIEVSDEIIPMKAKPLAPSRPLSPSLEKRRKAELRPATEGDASRRRSRSERQPLQPAREADFSPDTIRTRRVRDLLQKLMIPEG